MLIEELIERAFCDGYEQAQKEFAFKTAAKQAYKVTQNSPFSREAKLAANKLVTKTKGQVENVTHGLIGASSKRKDIVNKAISNRANRLANISNNATRDAKDMITGKQMENIIMR